MAMKFSTRGASSGKTPFELCPPGPQQLVVCDVVDHGMVPDTWKRGAETEQRMIHKCTVKWQSAHKMTDGRPYLVSKRYTASMHEKASLRIDIGLMRGRKLSDDEARNLDVESIIGWNCFSNIEHENKGAKGVFAEVKSLMPLPPGMPKIAVRDYTREVGRGAKPAPAQPAAADTRATEAPPNAGEAWEPPVDPERSFDYDAPLGDGDDEEGSRFE